MATEGVMHSNGIDLEYRIEGTGPNALVIGSSIYYPRLFSKNLRKHLRLVFADMRAFAPPPHAEISLDFDINALLDDIECMRSQLNLGKVIIIGHSGNAFLALEYAKKYPEHVSHVVMIAISPDLSERSKKIADEYWERAGSADRKNALKNWLTLYPDSQEQQIPINERFIWNYTRHTPRIWYDFNFDPSPLWQGVNVNMPIFEYVWGTLYRDIDITNGLETLNKPIFLALGRYDFIMEPPNVWVPLQPKFKDLSICIFERSGHSPCYEEAEQFDAKLLDWLFACGLPKHEDDRRLACESPIVLHFAPAKSSQMTLLHRWFEQNHIKEWLHGAGLQNTLNGLEKFFLGKSTTTYWVGYDKEVPIAFLITSPEGEDAITLDVFICDVDYLGKGLAGRMIRVFNQSVFSCAKSFNRPRSNECTRDTRIQKSGL